MVSITAGAILGAGALTAGAGIIGSQSAARAQKDAANTAANTQLSMYNQTRGDLMPYFQGGQNAFSNLSSLLYGGGQNQTLGPGTSGQPTTFGNMGSQLSGILPSSLQAGGGGGGPNTSGMLSALQNYPGYQFALQQGGQALDRSAAARGALLSGGQLKDLTAYGQGMGSQLFNQYFNQNYQLASLGENAAAQTGNAGSNAAAGAASSQLAAGTAAASGIAGTTNAIQGGLQSALQAYQLNNGSAGYFPNSPTSNTTPYATYTGYNPNAGYTIQPQL